MALLIENIELDESNKEFGRAVECIKYTDELIFLTGRAGTGKTTFLKYIKKEIPKKKIVLAPTGVAAINAGGVTIHSFFQLPFSPFIPGDKRLQLNGQESIFSTFQYNDEKRDIIANLELLIIDEISMVRADVLDVIDRILRVFRKKPGILFGGVQVLLIGDTFQLPPIAQKEEWDILGQFYATPFFFNAKVIENNTPVYIELKKIYRQKEQSFIGLLNRIRENKVSLDDIGTLNSKYHPEMGEKEDHIILATHNYIVRNTNSIKLEQLKKPLFTYEAEISGDFPERNAPTEKYLELSIGAQVMFVKNDSGENKAYYNGRIGKIKELDEDLITVQFEDASEVDVEKSTWENIRYTYNSEKKQIEEEVAGSFKQFPIKLAWAITVHKSQGLTFEKVIADLGQAFDYGQVYVALSRCTSFDGLILKSPISPQVIKTSPHALEFAKKETPDIILTEFLDLGKANYASRHSSVDNGTLQA